MSDVTLDLSANYITVYGYKTNCEREKIHDKTFKVKI